MAPADQTPDFDSMTPEEIMAWMETLAKRQGAKLEELTTSADTEIAEIDPNTAVIDEPGYVPYGEERPDPSTRNIASLRSPGAEPSVPTRREPVVPRFEPEPPLPSFDAEDDYGAETRVAASAGKAQPDPLAWLENLAAEQADALFNIDLSALTEELEHPEVEAEEAPINPVAWLDNLMISADEPVSSTETLRPNPAWSGEAEPVSDPLATGVDPMAWLETLARRQGAKDEELTTSAALNIPVPQNPVIDEPGYKPFSFDDPLAARHAPEPPDPLDLANPADWLEWIADSQGFEEESFAGVPVQADDEPMDVNDIERAISEGTVSPEQMQQYLEHQTDLYVRDMSEPQDTFDPNAPPVPADIPDWLLEQVGAPPSSEAAPSESSKPPIETVFGQAVGDTDIPDWLRDDVSSQGDFDFDSIFIDTTEEDEESADLAPWLKAEAEAVVAPSWLDEEPAAEEIGSFAIEIDPSDPWVEAFDLEQGEGSLDVNTVPDWYANNLTDPQRIAAVEDLTGEDSVPLTDAMLPAETELQAGEPEAVPDWMHEPEAEAPAPVAADVSDWMREDTVQEEAEESYAWLVEDAHDEPPVEETIVEPARPAPAASGDLESARTRSREGDVAAALVEYEALIRVNADLDFVVSDLQSLSRAHRDNPAVYRVLGDGLMRQGKLQAALDIYREALNQL